GLGSVAPAVLVLAASLGLEFRAAQVAFTEIDNLARRSDLSRRKAEEAKRLRWREEQVDGAQSTVGSWENHRKVDDKSARRSNASGANHVIVNEGQGEGNPHRLRKSTTEIFKNFIAFLRTAAPRSTTTKQHQREAVESRSSSWTTRIIGESKKNLNSSFGSTLHSYNAQRDPSTLLSRALSPFASALSESLFPRSRRVYNYVISGTDVMSTATFLEASVGVTGCAVGIHGLLMSYATQNPLYDIHASLMMSSMVIATSYFLLTRTTTSLLGQALPERTVGLLVRKVVSEFPSIADIYDIKTEILGTDTVRFKAEVRFNPEAVSAHKRTDFAARILERNAMLTQAQVLNYFHIGGENRNTTRPSSLSTSATSGAASGSGADAGFEFIPSEKIEMSEGIRHEEDGP
ncbi:unnamed protein product, partial [Amoebophrya sp. A25]